MRIEGYWEVPQGKMLANRVARSRSSRVSQNIGQCGTSVACRVPLRTSPTTAEASLPHDGNNHQDGGRANLMLTGRVRTRCQRGGNHTGKTSVVSSGGGGRSFIIYGSPESALKLYEHIQGVPSLTVAPRQTAASLMKDAPELCDHFHPRFH